MEKTNNLGSLDKKDWRILEILCENSRLSHNQVAKKVLLSKNAVTYRINRLQRRGIITGFFTIIDHNLFGLSFYEILFKINAEVKEKEELLSFLKKHPNIIVIDRLSGEFNLVLEVGCKNQKEFFSIIQEIKIKFSDIIDYFEVHPILYSYKVEQLPIELLSNRPHRGFKEEKILIKLDKKDKKLLLELNKDSTQPLHILAEKLKVTYETISARIKKLVYQGVIVKFTARVSLAALGYDTYLLILDLQNFSELQEKKLRAFIMHNKNIRYSFLSASKPQVFIYFASKNSDELDNFMNFIKSEFPDVITNQKYLLSKQQYKYELFTEGML